MKDSGSFDKDMRDNLGDIREAKKRLWEERRGLDAQKDSSIVETREISQFKPKHSITC